MFGHYPPSMQKLAGDRLPQFSTHASKLVSGSLDFVGINHYTTLYARNDRLRIRKLVMDDASTDSAVIPTAYRHGKKIGETVQFAKPFLPLLRLVILIPILSFMLFLVK
jgi:beta-glucosidase